MELLLGRSTYYGSLLQRDDALSTGMADVLQFTTPSQISVTTVLARFPDFKPSNLLFKEIKKKGLKFRSINGSVTKYITVGCSSVFFSERK